MGIYTGEAPAAQQIRHIMDLATLNCRMIHAMQDTRSPEERMRDHAFAEARREVESWWTGDVYRWAPFEG